MGSLFKLLFLTGFLFGIKFMVLYKMQERILDINLWQEVT